MSTSPQPSSSNRYELFQISHQFWNRYIIIVCLALNYAVKWPWSFLLLIFLFEMKAKWSFIRYSLFISVNNCIWISWKLQSMSLTTRYSQRFHIIQLTFNSTDLFIGIITSTLSDNLIIPKHYIVMQSTFGEIWYIYVLCTLYSHFSLITQQRERRGPKSICSEW